jgi:hypothetical protein
MYQKFRSLARAFRCRSSGEPSRVSGRVYSLQIHCTLCNEFEAPWAAIAADVDSHYADFAYFLSFLVGSQRDIFFSHLLKMR